MLVFLMFTTLSFFPLLCRSFEDINNDLLFSNKSILPRKSRYLGFPDKSNLLLTITLLKGTAFDRRLNTLHEIDVPVPLPRNWLRLKYKVRRQDRSVHREDRAILYSHLESALDLFGFDGRACIMRLICDVKKIQPKLVESIVLELIFAIFTFPNGGAKMIYDYALNDSCDMECPISIMDIIKEKN